LEGQELIEFAIAARGIEGLVIKVRSPLLQETVFRLLHAEIRQRCALPYFSFVKLLAPFGRTNLPAVSRPFVLERQHVATKTLIAAGPFRVGRPNIDASAVV